MIEEIPARCGNCIGFRARGKLTEDDYNRVLIPGIEKGIESYSKVNILFQVEDFKGWTAGGAWEDLMTGRNSGMSRSLPWGRPVLG